MIEQVCLLTSLQKTPKKRFLPLFVSCTIQNLLSCLFGYWETLETYSFVSSIIRNFKKSIELINMFTRDRTVEQLYSTGRYWQEVRQRVQVCRK